MKDYHLGVYEKSMPNSLCIKQKLNIAKQAGFDFLEMSIDETKIKLDRLYYSAELRNDIKFAIIEERFPIKTICLSGHRKYSMGSNDKTIELKSMEIMRKAIDFANDIGVRIIQLAGYDVYYEESSCTTKKRFFDNLRHASELASSAGIILALETMENDFMNTCEKAMQYVQMIDSPYLGLYPDTGNITNATKDVEADLRTGKGHIFAAHLKETIDGYFREIPYGAGHTDFPKVIRVLRSMGVNLFLCEFWYDGTSEPLTYIRAAHDFIRHQFDKAVENRKGD